MCSSVILKPALHLNDQPTKKSEISIQIISEHIPGVQFYKCSNIQIITYI